uniref:Uncharacterized protein n=1 Tax=Cacopsylla melanoneura TaxID=428564 RepID=A0A8D9ELW3_9HEMI
MLLLSYIWEAVKMFTTNKRNRRVLTKRKSLGGRRRKLQQRPKVSLHFLKRQVNGESKTLPSKSPPLQASGLLKQPVPLPRTRFSTRTPSRIYMNCLERGKPIRIRRQRSHLKQSVQDKSVAATLDPPHRATSVETPSSGPAACPRIRCDIIERI